MDNCPYCDIFPVMCKCCGEVLSDIKHPVPDASNNYEWQNEFYANIGYDYAEHIPEIKDSVELFQNYIDKGMFAASQPAAVPDEAGEVQRPNIKDYFGEDADLKTVMAIYDSQPELFNYAQALDRYIDDTLHPSQPAGNGVVSIQCKCKPDDKHGETSVMCCNDCGLPCEPFWDVIPPNQ